MSTELPENLKSLAAELDALAGRASASSGGDSLPTLDGTDFEPFAERREERKPFRKSRFSGGNWQGRDGRGEWMRKRP